MERTRQIERNVVERRYALYGVLLLQGYVAKLSEEREELMGRIERRKHLEHFRLITRTNFFCFRFYVEVRDIPMGPVRMRLYGVICKARSVHLMDTISVEYILENHCDLR